MRVIMDKNINNIIDDKNINYIKIENVIDNVNVSENGNSSKKLNTVPKRRWADYDEDEPLDDLSEIIKKLNNSLKDKKYTI